MGRHLERGHTLFALKRYREAAAEYQRELVEYPESFGANLNLGLALYNLGRFEEAEETIRKAIEIEPDYAHCYCALACTRAAQGHTFEAEEIILEAIRREPGVAEYHLDLAHFRLRWHRYKEAREAIKDALRCDPIDVNALLMAAHIETRMGNLGEADKLLQTALQQEPENPRVHASMGVMSLKKNENPDAMIFLKGARQIDPIEHVNQDHIALAYGRQCWPFNMIDSFLRLVRPWNTNRKWGFLAASCTAIVGWGVLAPKLDLDFPIATKIGFVVLSWLMMYVMFPYFLIRPSRLIGRLVGRRDFRVSLWSTLDKQLLSSLTFVAGLHLVACILALGTAVSPIFAYVVASLLVNGILLFSLPRAIPYFGYAVLILAIFVVSYFASEGAKSVDPKPFQAIVYWLPILGISALGPYFSRLAQSRPPVVY